MESEVAQDIFEAAFFSLDALSPIKTLAVRRDLKPAVNQNFSSSI